MATAFLQFAGPKLLEPFTDFVRHVHSKKSVYNPPIHDPEAKYEPDFHIILGGIVSVKEVKKPKQTKMNFASGRAGTTDDFIAQLRAKQKGNHIPILRKLFSRIDRSSIRGGGRETS